MFYYFKCGAESGEAAVEFLRMVELQSRCELFCVPVEVRLAECDISNGVRNSVFFFVLKPRQPCLEKGSRCHDTRNVNGAHVGQPFLLRIRIKAYRNIVKYVHVQSKDKGSKSLKVFRFTGGLSSRTHYYVIHKSG